jgi:hypothetical protein
LIFTFPFLPFAALEFLVAISRFISPSPFAGALAAMPRWPLASLSVINGRIAKGRQPKPTPDVSRYIVREKLN